MTTRGQFLRSSTPGQKPAAGSRQPGEMWLNFADKQIGLIDTTKTAQPMIAVRFFSTAANYASGDFVVQAGGIWVAKSSITAGAFNSTQWSELAYLTDVPALYVLPTASTTVLGGVKVDGVTVTISSGVISSAGLVTVAATAPSPVQNGALWYDLAGGQLYVWANDGSSSQWVVAVNQSISGVYLPLAGGALTGPLTLAGDPVNSLDAATKQYVDAKPGPINDNRIINGDMRIDQRNNGASGTALGYTCDRWQYSAGLAGKGNWQRSNAAGTPGFPYSLGFASSSAYASLAGDYFYFGQIIEADMVSDFRWGTASAQSVTLSFWVYSSLTGTFSGAVENAATTRSYPFTYSIPVASTWTKIAVTIPGDTAGTWVMSGNVGSMQVLFDLGTGTTFRGPANAWASANYVGATGSVSVVGTNAALFYLTGVKLEIGSVATPFNRQSLAKSMVDCQRYYQTSGNVCLEGYSSGASATVGSTIWFQAQMRAMPTLVHSGESYSNGSGLAFDQITQNVCRALWTGNGAGRSAISGLSFNLSAEL